MGLNMTWQAFLEGVAESTGSVVYNTLTQVKVGEVILEKTCEIASRDPRWYGLPAYERGFYRGVCGGLGYDVPIPQSQMPTFTGGQCCDKTYLIDVKVILKICYLNQIVLDSVYKNVEIQGKIEGIDYVVSSINASFTALEVYSRDCSGNRIVKTILSSSRKISANACYTVNPSLAISDAVDKFASEYEIQNVRTKDGSLDNCGSLLPPGLSEVTTPQCVSYLHTGESVAKVYCFDPNNGIDREFCFSSDEYTICISPDGISIRRNGEVDERSETGGEGLKPFNEEDYEEEDKGETEDEENDEDQDIEWVVVKVTTDPHKGKVILHQSAEDRQLFAGYFCWIVKSAEGSYHLETLKIDKPGKAYKNPGNATGYRVTAINGAKLQVSKFKTKVEQENGS